MKNIYKVSSSIFVCEAIGLISTPFTMAAIPTWYALLHKPFFSPPNWLFGPVWTLLYALMGISFFLIWKQGFKKTKNIRAATFFFLQLILNFLWSILFFGLRSPLLGFMCILILWVLILLTIKSFLRSSQIAGFLLFPYLFWVSFAMLLNLAIVLLN